MRTGTPANHFELMSTLDGKLEFSLHYLEYENGLPFDPSLFELPEGLKSRSLKYNSPATRARGISA